MDPIECEMDENPKRGEGGGGGGGAAEPDDRASMNSLILWNITKALEQNPNMNLEGALREVSQLVSSSAYGAVSRALASEQRHLACALLAWQQLGHRRVDSLLQLVESREKAKAHVASLIQEVHGEAEQQQPVQFKNYSDCVIQTSHVGMNGSRPSVMGPVVTLPALPRPRLWTQPGGARPRASAQPSLERPWASPPCLARPLVMRVEDSSGQAPTTSRRVCCKGPPKASSALPRPPPPLRAPSSNINQLQQRCCKRRSRDANAAESFASGPDEAADEESVTSAEEGEPAGEVAAELRARTRQLARRQAQRAELLQRAEAAWQDLERGFQKKLQLSKEKEENIAKQLEHVEEEYEEYKKVTSELDENLKSRIAAVEAEKSKLMEMEKAMCELACTRHQLNEDANKKKGTLSKQQCNCLQYERDNQFKEEQAKNKMNSVKNDLEAARLLALEAERVRAKELKDIKNSITQTAAALKREEDENDTRTEQLEQLRKKKEQTEKALGECKLACETAVSEALEDLRRRRLELGDMQVTVAECRCQLPEDAAVEAKRTPSLAVVCYCPPDGKPLKGCSCTTLRCRLLTDLLHSLFGGLQEELGLTGSSMPCQLLKCLDDKHNWDRSTDLKIHLKNYFLQLLVGEMEIAIAASIEMYHAKWIGACCADRGPPCPTSCQALEARARELAEELMKQQSAASQYSCDPCRCDTRVYTCQVQPQTRSQGTGGGGGGGPGGASRWRRTLNHVTLLRSQIEDLKRESIKKTDLSLMEQKIVKLVQRASGPNRAFTTFNKESKELKRNLRCELEHDKIEAEGNTRDAKKHSVKMDKPKYQAKSSKEIRNVKVKLNRCDTNEQIVKFNEFNKASMLKNLQVECGGSKRRKSMNQCKMGGKKPVTVNMCYTVEKDDRTLMEAQPDIPSDEDDIPVCETTTINTESNISYNAINTIEANLHRTESQERKLCDDSCVCFNKIPASVSINEVLKSLSYLRKNMNAHVDDTNDDFQETLKTQLARKQNDQITLKRSERDDCDFNSNTVSILPINHKDNIKSVSDSKEIVLKCNTGSISLKIPSEIPEKDILENERFNLKLPTNESVRLATFDVHSSKEINNQLHLDTLNEFAVPLIKVSNQKKYQTDSNNFLKVLSPMSILSEKSKYVSKNNINKSENITSKSHESGKKNVTSSDEDMLPNFETQNEIQENPPTSICSEKNSNAITSLIDSTNKMRQIVNCVSNRSNRHSDGSQRKRNMESDFNLNIVNQDRIFGITMENNYTERNQAAPTLDDVTHSIDGVANKIVDDDYSIPNFDTNVTEEKSANVKFSTESNLDESGKQKNKNIDKNGISKGISAKPLFTNNESNYKGNKNDKVCGTESEYMGEINLDKSIEHNCRCGADYDFKCINSKLINATNCKCEYEKQSKIDYVKNSTANEVLLDNLPVNPFVSLSAPNKLPETVTIDDINYNIKMNENNSIKETIYDVIRKSNLFPSNYDYDVNFLGVTLKNDKCLKPFKTEVLDSYRVNSGSDNNKKYSKMVPFSNKKCTHNVINKAVVTDITSNSNENKTCNCNQNLKEIEGMVDRIFLPYKRTKQTKDEALDTQSLMREFEVYSRKDEPCVCCDNNFLKEESENLEVNTYELIREHLKKKIQEFTRNVNYESNRSCISKDEEDKLLTSILHNVQEVIFKNTNSITCRCNTEMQMEHSWNRAYILLQEYLKTKIQRVQCSCSTTVENDRNSLNDILNKVNKHIDNDFERLKKRCKSESPKQNIEHTPIKLEKDNISQTSKVIAKDCNTTDVSAKIIQNAIDETTQKSFVKCDVPSQVSRYFDAQNKGCDALVLTVTDNGNQSSLEFGSQEKERGSTFFECLCAYDNSTQPNHEDKSHVIKKETDKFESNRHCTEIIGDNIDRALALPYVGCTIECSCDKPLSQCDCAKCVLRNNNDKTSTLYNHYLDKSLPQNVAYIMENALNPSDKINVNDLFHDEQFCKQEYKAIATEVKSVQYVCNTRRNTMTSVSSPETMILKDSSSINRRKKLTTNTFVQNVFGSSPSAVGDLPLLENVESVPGDPLYFPIGCELSEVASQNCDCKTVPICHVKMLVEDIENRLADCKCVCDSLIPKVCPVHSFCN